MTATTVEAITRMNEGGNELTPSMHALSTSPPPFISEEMVMDYFTLRGIENKLGVKREEIPAYILHELIDNALDYIESKNEPEINVDITTNENNAIRLKVSNPDARQCFTDKIIEMMFNYYNYSSTKRNQFKIGRGALGHGLKTVLSSAYALATEHYGCSNWTPLKIRNRDKLWTISLSINRNTGYRPPHINSKITDDDDILRTEIEIDIPTDDVDKDVQQLKQVFYKYLILNPHITMNLIIDGEKHSHPRVQKIKSDWKNLHSIHSYSEKDFDHLISTLENKGTLYDAIISVGIKEAYSLTKRTEFNVPLTEAQHDKAIIHMLYQDLKEKPVTKKLDLTYDMRVRKKAITKRLEQLGIKVLKIKYNSINQLYRSEDGETEFPFVCECAEIVTDSTYAIISGINSSVSDLINIHNPSNFKYDKKSDSRAYYTASSISDLLQRDCGYNRNTKEFKKENNIVFINLISPRIDYESYAKSQINLKPFSELDSVGQLVYNTFKSGNARHRIKGKLTQTEIRLQFLTDRYNAVKQNPELILNDRWTNSDVWYGCRPILLDNGIVIGPNTRSNFTALIRQTCEEEFNCNMEELGIFAADRAQLYFDGRWYDVGFDELDSLAIKGTDLVIFEKEGMAETLTSIADKLGLAILFTRGFATKYVRDLSEMSKKHKCNVLVLSDYDASGILLASKLNIPRIGIDTETLAYFGLEYEDVEEEYNPRNHLEGIRDLVSEDEFEYLSKKRIEINSVKMKVDSKQFQDWIIYKIKEKFPTRDYNRAIKLDVVLPDEIKECFDYITNIVKDLQQPEREKTSKTLRDREGFLDVPKERSDIENRLKKVITKDQMKRIINSRPFFNSNSKNNVNDEGNDEGNNEGPDDGDQVDDSIQAEIIRECLRREQTEAKSKYLIKHLDLDKDRDLHDALRSGISVDFAYKILRKRELGRAE